MSEKEWATRYTDERYLTKTELQSVMGTSLIDGYWNDVIHYREKNAVSFSFLTPTKKPFFIVLTPAIKEKIALADAKAMGFLSYIRNLREPHQTEQIHRLVYFSILKSVSSFEKADMSDLSIKALLNGTYAEDNPAHSVVIAYKDSLDYYSDKPVAPADADFLADAYSHLLRQSELTSFYRTRDFDDTVKRAKFIYDFDLPYAPHDMVDGLMTDFLSWLSDSSVSRFVKMSACLCYLDYIKPFDEKNDSLATLLAKDCYGVSGAEQEAFFLPLESIVLKNKAYEEIALETQRTGDLTYFTMMASERLVASLDALIEEIKSIRIEAYAPEYRVPDLNKKGTPEQLSLPLKKAASEEAPQSKETATPAPQEKIAPVISPTNTIKKSEKITASPNLSAAVTIPSPFLSEKEVKEYITYLRETNPNLNRNQASFLASHCTAGRYYTIQQFKTAMHCAYETARTSMDKLAAQGYYEKLQVKNKFVYSPASKGVKKQ